MANKERNKRSARKARAEERAQREALQAEATP
ncbi:MAG: preprotein translocase subunit SecE, partial [Lancefieldella parvula]|nr:preprotein translocase subunit SecE [Lancefieldella parvula]